MKTKMKWKFGIDILMSIVLLLLMAYQVTGDVLHEIFGSAILKKVQSWYLHRI